MVLGLDALKPFYKETQLLDKKPLSLFALYSPPREHLLLFSRPLQLDIRILIRGRKDWEEHIDMTGSGGTVEMIQPTVHCARVPVCCGLG